MKIDDLTKSYILLPYIKSAAARLKHSYVGPTKVAVECVYCGTKELKGTIYLANTGRLCYNCWKTGCTAHETILAEKWLKEVDNSQYNQYIIELMSKENSDNYDFSKLEEKINKENIAIQEQQEKELIEKRKNDNLATKFFKKITIDSPIANKAVEYCVNRKIPEDIWKNFFVAVDGKYKNRLIIPFYDKNRKITYFQGRALDDRKPKYMNRTATETSLYNIDFVDINQPLFILEGPIDSMFIENAVATCGAGSSAKIDKILEQIDKKYYIFDNDASGNKKAGQIVGPKNNVFLWSKFLMDNNINTPIKDVNDVIIKLGKTEKYKYNELCKYFTNVRDEFLCYVK